MSNAAAHNAPPQDFTAIQVHREGPWLHVTLNRPEVRNAMSVAMVEELRSVWREVHRDPSCRAVILRGAGGHFCAGGDVRDMASAQSRLTDTHNPYVDINRVFGHLLCETAALPVTVICVLEGSVLGGGFGLACVSDVALAAADARFGMPETGLGVIPAQIAPFVVNRIGLTQARRLALLGTLINGEDALRIGLVHEVATASESLDNRLEAVLTQLKRCAPQANRITKALLMQVGNRPLDALLDDAATLFGAAVVGEEAREGTLAFVQKRPPEWAR